MKTKEVKIQVPEGYEIDRENSTFECIKFKPKTLTYEDIALSLFKGKTAYYLDGDGALLKTQLYNYADGINDPNNAPTKQQWEKLLALNKLINVAKYLNEGWQPDFTDYQNKYYIYYFGNKPSISCIQNTNFGIPYFKSHELAKQAIEILGEETIKLALSQV